MTTEEVGEVRARLSRLAATLAELTERVSRLS